MTNNDGKYTSFRTTVPAEYETVFSHFYMAQNETDAVITKTFFPTYQTILIFNFGTKAILYSQEKTEIKVGKCLILGPIKKAFDYALPPMSEILVANFKEDAFYRFFGNAAVAENFPVDPDELLNENCFTALWTALNKIGDTNQRVNFILDFCKPYLKQRNTIAEKLADFNDEALNSIKSVASQQNQTERNIQLNHKKHLGYTAKEINRYQRFLKAVELIQKSAAASIKIDWFKVIDECGYYDQSQLIHDFKLYINLSPTKYLKFQQEICNTKS